MQAARTRQGSVAPSTFIEAYITARVNSTVST